MVAALRPRLRWRCTSVDRGGTSGCQATASWSYRMMVVPAKQAVGELVVLEAVADESLVEPADAREQAERVRWCWPR